MRAGSAPAGGRAVEVGLAAGGSGDPRCCSPAGPSTRRRVRPRSDQPHRSRCRVESTAPAQVALAAVAAVLDLAGALVLAVPAVATALDRPAARVDHPRGLLTGVLLDAGPHLISWTPACWTAALLHRLGWLLANLAAAPGAR